MGNRECWAAEVSECDGGLSRDHYFSAGLLRDLHFDVTGASFGPRTALPASAMTTKTTCRRHNSLMSPLDQEAVDVANVLRRLKVLHDQRRAARKLRVVGPSPIAFELNGTRFERWMLKVMFGVLPIFPEHAAWRPPLNAARAVFGLEPLPKGCGLAFAQGIGDELVQEMRFAIGFGSFRNEKVPSAIFVTFLGWEFFCSWDRPVEAFYPLQLRKGDPIFTKDNPLVFHLTRLRMNTTSATNGRAYPANLFLDFSWGHPDRAPGRNVVALRGRQTIAP